MAKMTDGEINDAVKDLESKRRRRINVMRQSESMWTLGYWSDKDRREADIEGRELHTSVAPRNALALAQWLITSDVRFHSLAEGEDAEELANQQSRERFLKALWYQQSHIAKIHPIDAVKWHLLVHGEAVIQPQWIHHNVPKIQQPFVPPINMRALSPLNVAVERGPYGILYGYHRYQEVAVSLAKRYPKAKRKIAGRAGDKDLVEVTDFWYQDGDKVHNVIMADDITIRKFTDTGYPFVPLIHELADGSPTECEESQGNSLVGHLRESWGTSNMLSSIQLTAVRDHFWPSLNVTNENDQEIPDIERGRGAVNVLPSGTTFLGDETSRPQNDLLESFASVLDREHRQGTFPDALYGDTGQQRSALGFNGMTEAGQGRIRGYIKAMQRVLERASQLALCLVAVKADRELDLYSYNDVDDVLESVTIGPSTTGKRKVVKAVIKDQVASDRLQLMVGALQLYDRHIISGRTVLEDYAPKDPREDEYARVVEEQVRNDPDLIRETMRRLWEERTGTPFPEPQPQQVTPQQPRGIQTEAVIPELQAGAQAGGQITPETLTGNMEVDALVNQMMMSGQVATPEQALRLIMQGV